MADARTNQICRAERPATAPALIRGTTPSRPRTGAIVTGATADQAIEAALAAYPGGVVDRVVQPGDGDYEVHYIGVNWPHHIFVNQSFQVIGANS